MIKAIIKKNTTFLYIKFNISGSDQLGSTSGWLRSQQPFIHPWTNLNFRPQRVRNPKKQWHCYYVNY